MCFILLFSILNLILSTENLIYTLFFAVYGVDSVITIIFRLLRRENIFRAHRTHLYQYMANEGKGNRLIIATCYGLLQVGIGLLIISIARMHYSIQLSASIFIILFLVITYLGIRRYTLRSQIN